MFSSRKSLRLALAGAALAAGTLGTPAHADSTGLINYSVGNCGYLQRQVCAGYGQGVPVGLSSLTVVVTCSATSPFVVDRTGVSCYLVGLNDRIVYLPTGQFFLAGNESVTANFGTVPFQGYQLCVGAGYSTTGGEFKPVQGYRCL